MFKALIFDVGGTLVKTDEALLEALDKALAENGLVFKNKSAVIEIFGQGQMKNVRTAVTVSYDGAHKEQKVQQCLASFQRLFPRQVISQFRIFPHVLAGLQTLRRKGKKLVVLTGFYRRETNFFLARLGLAPCFDMVLSAEDIVEHRPHPKGLLLAVEKLRLPKEEVLYVGDTWVDVQFAKNAGINVAIVKTGVQEKARVEQEKPNYFVDDFQDVVEIARGTLSS